MRTMVLSIVILALLALDWAALHDIVKANEPNYTLEYGMLAISIAVFTVLGAYSWRGRRAAS